ncbi:MAG: hypothetical protein MUP47_10115 [Phycisphaerae bacterium]|nr:hypothetical protein [Phycisphaerae bacterium]
MGENAEHQIFKKSTGDHVLATVTALVAGIPGIGGILATYMQEYIPRSTQKALAKAVDYLRTRINGIEERLDIASAGEDELADSAKSFFRSALSTSQDEKLRAAANLFGNSLLKKGDAEKLTYTEREHFSRCLDSLSIGALKVLRAMYQLRGRRTFQDGSHAFQSQDLVNSVADADPNLVLSLAHELIPWGLASAEDPQLRYYQKGYLANQQWLLSPMGTRFVQYVLEAGQHDIPKAPQG